MALTRRSFVIPRLSLWAVPGVAAILIVACANFIQVSSFVVLPTGTTNNKNRFQSHHECKNASPSSLFMSLPEFEYVPPNADTRTADKPITLDSVYPPGTPAALRGEAVRTALQSTQSLAWKRPLTKEESQSSPNLASGVLHLQGTGTLEFLNNKLTNSFRPKDDGCFSVTQACLLTAKGRLIDTLCVAYAKDEAFLIPSPGHHGADLFQRLDPFIFPMDQVKLKDVSSASTMFTVASTRREHVEELFRQQVLPKLQELVPSASHLSLDHLGKDECVVMPLGSNDQRLFIVPHTGLPECACQGYTFVFLCDTSVGASLWEYLIGETNAKGAIELRALEYETLRVEAGQPSYGWEVTGAWKDADPTPASPLELHQGTATYLDLDKGCYLGQEGVASVLKNPRGPPRALYSVIFDDDDNQYNSDEDDDDTASSRTQRPRPGNSLFVLGSNEEVAVGTITSVAEPYGTGDTSTVALALVRRADSVLKQMNSKDLQIPSSMAPMVAPVMEAASATASSGIIPPPPRDPLQGLEVIVGGTYSVGALRSIPSRRLPGGKNMFDDQTPALSTRQEIVQQAYVDIEFSSISAQEFLQQTVVEEEVTTDDLDSLEAKDDNEEDAAAEAEAKRKTEKMKMLQKRAEEALARRKQKQKQVEGEAATTKDTSTGGGVVSEEDGEAAEAKRKAEKMEMLKKRAEEAMARRRQKKEQ